MSRGKNQTFYGWPETVAQWVELLLGRARRARHRRLLCCESRAETGRCPELTAFASRVSERLGVGVSVQGSMDKGRLTLTYANAAELAHLAETLGLGYPGEDS